MSPGPRALLCAFIMTGALIAGFALSQTSEPEGHVTAIFNEVQVLPDKADARPAVINDKIDNGTALKTGDASRSELTFADLTITRLGANTIFSFNRAGRSVRLDSGAILLYVRKDSGGAQISTKAVSVAITGTTLIFESKVDSYDELTVLEGDARFSLNNFPNQSSQVRAAQLLHVRAGAKKLPKPGRVDLKRIMETHPLIRNFPPLPSLDLILAAADGRNPNLPLPPPQPPPPIGVTGSQGGPSPVYLPSGPSPVYLPTGPAPTLWCCIDGHVVQSTEAECRARGGQAFGSEREARAHCGGGGGGTCWCCIHGEVVQTTEADCREREGQCYGSKREASRNCRGAGTTPTPTPHRPYPTATPTPHRSHPTSTPKPILRPTPRQDYPSNQSNQIPTPKKNYPPIRRASPTPRPRKFIR
ncbi:MAG TPA: FecR family protein [Chthoniobacterales bacterium]|jgi:hypothetical protein|nr:FecR family protein [Chthoniobacterales bacterium]